MYMHRITGNEKNTTPPFAFTAVWYCSHRTKLYSIQLSFPSSTSTTMALRFSLAARLRPAHNVDLGKQKQRAGADDAAQDNGQHRVKHKAVLPFGRGEEAICHEREHQSDHGGKETRDHAHGVEVLALDFRQALFMLDVAYLRVNFRGSLFVRLTV